MAATAPLLLSADIDLHTQDPWSRVREHFLMPRDRIYLNVGTLGVQPRPVVHAVIDSTRKVAESLPAGVNWDMVKQATARIIESDTEGLAFPRNTTEAMNFIANGLDYRAGDHILTTNHEHIGGLCCWQLVAARRNLALTQVDISAAPHDPQQVFEKLRDAVTPRTRVISISHVNFTTGFVMPVQEIVNFCRSRGIISVIDGAHPPGLMPMSINQLNPDFYAGSPHKWLLAPQGTGLLWMGQEWRTKLWPTIASGEWDKTDLGAHRFNHLGTMDESRFAGLQAALDFYELVGPERIYTRIGFLRDYLMDALKRVRGIQLMTPDSPLSAGMVAFKLDGISSLDLQKRLAERKVRVRVISEYDYGYMRLAPHIYNSVEEIDRVLGMIRSGTRN